MSKLSKKDASDLRGIIEELECAEVDLEVWEAKASGTWPHWEHFPKLLKVYKMKRERK